jgi:hypothetical protein
VGITGARGREGCSPAVNAITPGQLMRVPIYKPACEALVKRYDVTSLPTCCAARAGCSRRACCLSIIVGALSEASSTPIVLDHAASASEVSPDLRMKAGPAGQGPPSPHAKCTCVAV